MCEKLSETKVNVYTLCTIESHLLSWSCWSCLTCFEDFTQPPNPNVWSNYPTYCVGVYSTSYLLLCPQPFIASASLTYCWFVCWCGFSLLGGGGTLHFGYFYSPAGSSSGIAWPAWYTKLLLSSYHPLERCHSASKVGSTTCLTWP